MASLQELFFKGKLIKIDLREDTKGCEKEESIYLERMNWLNEKQAMQQIEKYMAESEKNFFECYMKNVMTRLENKAFLN